MKSCGARTPIASVAALVAVLVCAGVASTALAATETIRVGGKAFTEQEILAELVAQCIERNTGLPVRRRFGLGGTDICHAALRAGELDLYVEYTGTALVNILGQPPIAAPAEAFRVVAAAYRDRFDLEWLPPIGFDNTYAIALRREQADELGVTALSQLGAHADALRGGFTAEFAERPDGLPALEAAIDARFGGAVDLDPGVMYDALARGQVDVIAAFATDPRLDPEIFTLLRDDLRLFPPYEAAPVVRSALLERRPELRDALVELAGTIDADTMRRLNGEVDLHGRAVRVVVTEFLDQRTGPATDPALRDGRSSPRSGVIALGWERRDQVWEKTVEHLRLVAAGLFVAILVGVPLGVVAHRHPRLRPVTLAAVEIVQTVPSLAMLAFLFALLGVLGFAPAAVALILYALLPIVVNTAAGLAAVPAAVRHAADAMGMSRGQRFRRVELPLAAPILLAGIRTAAVLTVGIATLSTYIGAGGLGDFIARGLARNDPRLTLLGAVPAALLAVALGGLIRIIELAAARRVG